MRAHCRVNAHKYLIPRAEGRKIPAAANFADQFQCIPPRGSVLTFFFQRERYPKLHPKWLGSIDSVKFNTLPLGNAHTHSHTFKIFCFFLFCLRFVCFFDSFFLPPSCFCASTCPCAAGRSFQKVQFRQYSQVMLGSNNLFDWKSLSHNKRN